MRDEQQWVEYYNGPQASHVLSPGPVDSQPPFMQSPFLQQNNSNGQYMSTSRNQQRNRTQHMPYDRQMAYDQQMQQMGHMSQMYSTQDWRRRPVAAPQQRAADEPAAKHAHDHAAKPSSICPLRHRQPAANPRPTATPKLSTLPYTGAGFPNPCLLREGSD